MSLLLKISSLDKDEIRAIRRSLVLMPEQSYFAREIVKSSKVSPVDFYLYDGEYISIPYSFGLNFLNITPNDITYSHKEININFTKTLLERQIPVVEEAEKMLTEFGSVVLNLYPSFGKTVVAGYLVSRFKKLCLILIHLVPLISQWEKTFEDFTDIKAKVVDDKVDLSDADVIICMDERIDKIDPNILDRVGILIIDEAHAFCVPSRVYPILRTYPRYTIVCTATLERGDQMERMIELICGDHKIKIESKKEHDVIKFETKIKSDIPLSRRGTPDWSKYVTLKSVDYRRNALILALIRRYRDHKILILTGRKIQAKILYDMINKYDFGEEIEKVSEDKITCSSTKEISKETTTKPKVSMMIGTMTKYDNSNILIGTISKLGTGFDEKSFCHDFDGRRIDMIILVQSIKNLALLEQCVGRGFRSDTPLVLDLVDDDPIVKKHWRERSKWYTNAKGRITTMKIDDELVEQIEEIKEKIKIDDKLTKEIEKITGVESGSDDGDES